MPEGAIHGISLTDRSVTLWKTTNYPFGAALVITGTPFPAVLAD
jgi:hypothetical protein